MLLIIFSLILVFWIISSYTWYKIQKVQKVFSEKSPTLISQPLSFSLGTHNYQSLCMFKIHEYAHFLNKQIRNLLIVGGDIGLCLAFSLSLLESFLSSIQNCLVLFTSCLSLRACVLSHVRLCNPMDCSPPVSSVHGIIQARILEWVAISYSKGSSQSRDQTCISCISCIGRQILYQ